MESIISNVPLGANIPEVNGRGVSSIKNIITKTLHKNGQKKGRSNKNQSLRRDKSAVVTTEDMWAAHKEKTGLRLISEGRRRGSKKH